MEQNRRLLSALLAIIFVLSLTTVFAAAKKPVLSVGADTGYPLRYVQKLVTYTSSFTTTTYLYTGIYNKTDSSLPISYISK